MRAWRWLLLVVACCLALPPLSAQSIRLGPQRIGVVLMNFSDDRREAVTPTEARASMAGVADWFLRSSYGGMQLKPDVFGWVTAPVAARGRCPGTSELLTQAKALLGSAIDGYPQYLFVSPNTSNCPGGSSSVGVTPSISILKDGCCGTAIHELGHGMLWLMHVTDPWDRMNPGGFVGEFGPLAKIGAGWLNTPNQPTARVVTTAGRYTLEAYEGAGRGVKVLALRTTAGGLLSGSTITYYADVRGSGRVSIHSGHEVVDLGGGDTQLDPGQTWRAPFGGLTVTTVASTSAGATLDVAYGTTPVIVPAQTGGLTVLTGSAEDQVRGVVADAAGNVFMAGGTASSNFVRTTGQLYAGSMDAFLTSYTATGVLRCSALIGGPGYDRAYAIALAPNGDLILAGRAGISFPTTAGVWQPTFGGDNNPDPAYGQQDGFIAAFDNQCQKKWATYAGGPDKSIIRDVAAGPSGIYIGMTGQFNQVAYDSPLVPPTALYPTRHGVDGVLARIALDGSTVLNATYIGGTASDGGNPSVLLDATGVYYVTGGTSTDLPGVTSASAQPTNHGGPTGDIYILKFSLDLAAQVYATYLGGTAGEGLETHHAALFADGSLAVSVYSSSLDWPSTPGVVQPTPRGLNDFGICVLNPTGTAFRACTYLGQSGYDVPEGVAVDALGRLVVTGGVPSGWASATPYGGGLRDGAIAVLPKDLTTIDYMRYIGGPDDDRIATAALMPDGRLLVGGYVTSGSARDGFWGIVSLPPPPAPSPCVAVPVVPSVTATANGGAATWTGSVTVTRTSDGCTGVITQ